MPSRADQTEGQRAEDARIRTKGNLKLETDRGRAEDARTKRLGTRGDHWHELQVKIEAIKVEQRGKLLRGKFCRPAKTAKALHSDGYNGLRPATARPAGPGLPRCHGARPCRGWPDTNARATRTTRREREGRRLQRNLRKQQRTSAIADVY